MRRYRRIMRNGAMRGILARRPLARGSASRPGAADATRGQARRTRPAASRLAGRRQLARARGPKRQEDEVVAEGHSGALERVATELVDQAVQRPGVVLHDRGGELLGRAVILYGAGLQPAVRVEEQGVAHVDAEFVHLRLDASEHADQAAAAQKPGRAVAAGVDGRGMPRRAELHGDAPARLRAQEGELAGGEALVRLGHQERRVDALEDLPRAEAGHRQSADRVANLRRQRRRLAAPADDVADEDHPAVAHLDHVVEVAAELDALAGGLEDHGELEPWEGLRFGWSQATLERLCDPVALLVEARVVEGHRGTRGEIPQQRQVGVVVAT